MGDPRKYWRETVGVVSDTARNERLPEKHTDAEPDAPAPAPTPTEAPAAAVGARVAGTWSGSDLTAIEQL
ncbi:MAG: hypothetical protein JSV80_07700, partial [Acidobacteriota bacterium]